MRAIFLGALLLLSACDVPDRDVLAVWDQGEIRVGELDAWLLSRPAGARAPADVDRDAWLRAEIGKLFEQRVLEEDRSIDERPGFAEAWERERRRALAAAALDRRNEAATVSPGEIREFFEAHRDEFSRPERRFLRHIFLPFPADAEEAGRAAVCLEAGEIRDRIAAGASFEAEARRHSRSMTAARGGVVGAVTAADLRRDAARVVFALEPGGLSEVHRGRAGCQIFHVQQIDPAWTPTLEEATSAVRRRLVEKRRKAWVDERFREAAAELGVEIPTVPERSSVEGKSAADVLFSVGDEVVRVGDVASRMAAGSSFEEAFRAAAGELLVAVAFVRSFPEDAARIEERVRRDLRVRAGRAADAEDVDPEVLREHYEKYEGRFVTDPAVEIALAAWPIGEDDPLDSLVLPRQVAERLRSAEAVDAAWEEISGPDVTKEIVPLTSLRGIGRGRPYLGPALRGDTVEGDVVGPYRYGSRLYVAWIRTVVPSRRLGFLEARDQVAADFTRMHAGRLERERGEAMRKARGFRVIDEHVAGFGARLVEGIESPS